MPIPTGLLTIYQRPGAATPSIYHVRDALAHHWTVTCRNGVVGTVQHHHVAHAKYYGRIDYRPVARRSRMTTNALLRNHYTEARARVRLKPGRQTVGYNNHTPRRHSTYMNLAMRLLNLLNASGHPMTATQYAEHFQVRVPGLHYEWCHLIAHGFNGVDRDSNIVLGSCHCNAEQLILESAMYHYRSEVNTFELHVDGIPDARRLARGAAGRFLHYGIMFRVLSRGGETLYERLIDCHRATRVNATMERLLFAGVVAAANSYLSRRSTAMDPRSRAAINAHFSNASQAGIPL